ncbi:hypothetical protein BJV74DRAFT_397958 [Russula compacta]|nr:hypothetical protein BJV74DRAFT_397958 [Russula compacta]
MHLEKKLRVLTLPETALNGSTPGPHSSKNLPGTCEGSRSIRLVQGYRHLVAPPSEMAWNIPYPTLPSHHMLPTLVCLTKLLKMPTDPMGERSPPLSLLNASSRCPSLHSRKPSSLSGPAATGPPGLHAWGTPTMRYP